MTRLLDILFSFLGILLLSPLLILIYLLIVLGSRGGGFYTQERIGKGGKPFRLYKFRSMRQGSDRNGLLTVGARDGRITAVGYFIRKYKMDELPQLFNVLLGDMSLVGPRPEVRKYVDMYTPEQRKVLSVRPGITDYASIEYANENELLGGAENPDEVYVRQILPDKIAYNMKYIAHPTIGEYLKIIYLTILKIFS